MQEVIVSFLVGISVLFIIRQTVRTWGGTSEGCGSGCGSSCSKPSHETFEPGRVSLQLVKTKS